MKRGDVVLAAGRGDYGKPRPWIVVQADKVTVHGYGSVLLCPLSTTLTGGGYCRVAVAPTPANGLREPSEAMVEKLTAVPLERVREVIGRLDAATMRAIDRALLLVLGFS